MFSWPVPAKTPAVTSSESPGRKKPDEQARLGEHDDRHRGQSPDADERLDVGDLVKKLLSQSMGASGMVAGFGDRIRGGRP